MSGFSPKLPLHRNYADQGYALTKSHLEVIQQNLKHLILTSPGERIMDIHFGCGLKRFLFEAKDHSTYSQIAGTMQKQIDRYMPFVSVTDIEIRNSTHMWKLHGELEELLPQNAGDLSDNEINIRRLYRVEALSRTAVLSIRI